MSLCHNKQYERQYSDMMCVQGHHSERVAGSGSAKEAVCDCVLFKDGKSFLVEVKTTKEKTFYVRKHVRLQLETMVRVANEQNIRALIAVKFKHRKWKQVDITEQIPKVIKC